MSRAKAIDTSQHSSGTQSVVAKLKSRIVNQDDAVIAMTNLLDKFESGFYDRNRPIGSLLFLGPTGSGKTMAVEEFVAALTGDPKRMLKIDCGEFQHSHEIARLIGSPPGYLGHRETHPFFTNDSIRQARSLPDSKNQDMKVVHGKELISFTVILFDEIEKASDSLWNLLLGILDKGSLTTGGNDLVDMRKTVIIMTSNIGSKELSNKAGGDVLGFLNPAVDVVGTDELKGVAVGAARRKFSPEFLNRLDEIVMFNTLTRKDLEDILEIELSKLQEKVELSMAIVKLVPSPAAKRQMLEEGFDKRYNARSLRRVVEKRAMLPVSRAIASRQVASLDTVIIDYSNGKWEYLVEKTY